MRKLTCEYDQMRRKVEKSWEKKVNLFAGARDGIKLFSSRMKIAWCLVLARKLSKFLMFIYFNKQESVQFTSPRWTFTLPATTFVWIGVTNGDEPVDLNCCHTSPAYFPVLRSSDFIKEIVYEEIPPNFSEDMKINSKISL